MTQTWIQTIESSFSQQVAIHVLLNSSCEKAQVSWVDNDLGSLLWIKKLRWGLDLGASTLCSLVHSESGAYYLHQYFPNAYYLHQQMLQ